MPTYEANGKLPDGTPITFTIEADDKEDAKIEFCHSLPMQDGKVITGCKIDLRTIKMAKDGKDSSRECEP